MLTIYVRLQPRFTDNLWALRNAYDLPGLIVTPHPPSRLAEDFQGWVSMYSIDIIYAAAVVKSTIEIAPF